MNEPEKNCTDCIHQAVCVHRIELMRVASAIANSFPFDFYKMLSSECVHYIHFMDDKIFSGLTGSPEQEKDNT